MMMTIDEDNDDDDDWLLEITEHKLKYMWKYKAS